MKTKGRKARLDRLKQENELLCKVNDKPCRRCGRTKYLVFMVNNARSYYCSKCGTWLKFESLKGKRTKKKITKTDKQKYIDYLKSSKWKAIRQVVAERDNFTCQRCGQSVKDYFEIHHKNYKHIFHEEDDLTCLVCLCKGCHEAITKKQKTSRKRKKSG